jgi:hypothetical protein
MSNSKKYYSILEAYYGIYEQTPTPSATPQAKPTSSLEDLRRASAQATMAGPSKEAQALMSSRTKALLGSDRLKAGVSGQENVAQMKASMSSTNTPSRSLSPINPEWAKANPKLATAEIERRRIRGTSQSDNPLLSPEMRARMPMAPSVQSPDVSKLPKGNQSLVSNPNAVKGVPPTGTPPKPTPSTTTAKPISPSPEQLKLYNQAYANRNNPFAKGRIKSELAKLTPEQKASLKSYASSQGHDWTGYDI